MTGIRLKTTITWIAALLCSEAICSEPWFELEQLRLPDTIGVQSIGPRLWLDGAPVSLFLWKSGVNLNQTLDLFEKALTNADGADIDRFPPQRLKLNDQEQLSQFIPPWFITLIPDQHLPDRNRSQGQISIRYLGSDVVKPINLLHTPPGWQELQTQHSSHSAGNTEIHSQTSVYLTRLPVQQTFAGWKKQWDTTDWQVSELTPDPSAQPDCLSRYIQQPQARVFFNACSSDRSGSEVVIVREVNQ